MTAKAKTITHNIHDTRSIGHHTTRIPKPQGNPLQINEDQRKASSIGIGNAITDFIE